VQADVGATGRIHNVKDTFGFGFIAPDVGGENIYFHSSDLIGVTIAELRAGDAVSFIPSMNERGPCAREVKKLSDSLR
jgi:cold shock CspA family protein